MSRAQTITLLTKRGAERNWVLARGCVFQVACWIEHAMKGELLIPHNRLRFDSGVLGKNRVATDFVKDMSHEIRTPLNVIIGLCEYLERDREAPLTSEQREIVYRMKRNAHALLQSVNRLLECVRTGKYE